MCPKTPQIHSTFPTCKLIMHHAPSRLMSYFSLPFRRTGFGFPFSFSFLGYHFMFYIISLKTEDFDTFHLSWLVNIQVNGLIAQTSRVEDSPSGTLRACWGSERCLSIEWPGDWITPRAIPVHRCQETRTRRRRTDNRLPFDIDIFLFLSLFPNSSISASSLI
jgi:hypothetical protein